MSKYTEWPRQKADRIAKLDRKQWAAEILKEPEEWQSLIRTHLKIYEFQVRHACKRAKKNDLL